MALKNILYPIKLFTKKLIGGEGENEEGDDKVDTKTPIYIIICIAVIALIFYLMKKAKEDYATIDRIHYGKINRKLPKKQLEPSNYNEGYEYSIDFWLYIDNMTYRYNEDKAIIIWKQNIKISIDKTDPTLKIEVYTLTGKPEILLFYNLPLQRWLHITVIIKNKYLDLLVNGKLYQTRLLKNIPMYENTNMHVCPNGGFSGYINKLHYYPYAINVNQIKQNFKYGPTNNTLLDIFNPTKTPKCSQK